MYAVKRKVAAALAELETKENALSADKAQDTENAAARA